jgi:hypothetical protein
MTWEHAAEARAALNAIVTDPEHGVGALSSAQTMSNLLKDLLPDAPREKSLLVAAAEAGLAGTLRDHVNQGMDADTAIRLTASSFSASTPFTPDACSWVTGEIATAIGISQPGSGPAGGLGGTPSGFDPIGQGAPTQMAPIPGSVGTGYNPGGVPTQGIPAAAQGGFGQGTGFDQGGGGFGQAAADTAATAPGAWPAGTGGLNQGAAGAGQAAGGWQAGQAGQAGFGQQGTGQAGGGGWQPAQGGYGPAGTGQPAAGGWQQPPGVYTPGGGGFGPPQRSRRGLIIGGSIAVVVILIIVLAVALSGGKKNPPSANGSTTPPPNPTTTAPTPTPAATGIEPLTTIMNATGNPVGKTCITTKVPTFQLNASTITDDRFCTTKTTGIIVWGYQFDSTSDFQAGYSHIKKWTGFNNTKPGDNCPPPGGSSAGTIGWFIKNSPRYGNLAHNQHLDCFMNGTPSRPTLIWSMPTQDAFFISKDTASGSSMNDIIKWWETVSYAP